MGLAIELLFVLPLLEVTAEPSKLCRFFYQRLQHAICWRQSLLQSNGDKCTEK